MNGDESQQFHNKDNLILGYVNINGLKEERWKEKYTSHENIKIL